ncbi:isoleucine--tRNA ligase [Candidatus Pacearchaeota archaeon CG10_big_fil_rev_8_21_14_0_10_34_12]|nr:MAG: isoleucine--tRNA ligase [Candidatus Pacearchaeota archaeon CG10_big_fil_rev_8_21_14_0_10_34_12]
MYNHKEVESKVSDFWKKNKIEEKARKKSKEKSKKYFFMDGPPYASGHIHMGTALNKILKDISLRSRRMQGFNVIDMPGYDTHGVPIEYQIEKEIGVKTKQDIEDYGVEKFIKKCREFVEGYIKIMNEEFSDLGVWMDWENAYKTYENKYIESIWWTFKEAYKKDLLYLGKYPVHVCPRCETAVAYNEIVHKEQEDTSIFVKFPVEGEKKKFFIIWTTTPWTLPGNTGIMVNPDFDYAEVEPEDSDEVWVIAKDLTESLMDEIGRKYKIKKILKGRELEGKKYENPLAKNLNLNLMNSYKVILSKRYVNLDEGTGLVHCAPGHGKEDYDASRKYKIDILSPVGLNGLFTEEAGKYSGKKARVVDTEIIEDLDKDGFLVYSKKYTHDYPLCWRCSSPLLMISVPQWFFRVSSIHKKLLSENGKVNWIPSWGEDRMKAWLEGISDWPISRERYWGTPLPIWTCDKCDEKIVVGSASELEKLSGKKLKDLHKPYIDDVTIKCKSCKGTMKRITEVLDVWFDAGVSSWAALDYPRDKKMFKKFWPADLNLEGPDQFRGWWNSELILSTIVFDKKPFESIYVHGMVLDISKKKMSKSLGNIVSPKDVIEKHGRDALRFYMSLINPGENISYKEDFFREINRFFNILSNISNLIKNEYNLNFSENSKPINIEDKWIISRLNNLIKETMMNYEKYMFYKNTELISKFVLEDFSRTYIQLVRERINSKDKTVGEILNHVLSSVLLVSAPIIPYLTDFIYREMKNKNESIHFCSLPKTDKKKINKKLEEGFDVVFKIIEKGMMERDRAKVGLKWPLKKMFITGLNSPLTKEMFEIIKNRLNIKEISFNKINKSLKEKEEISVAFDTTMTKELEAEGYAREISRIVQDSRKKIGLNKKDKIELIIFTDGELKEMLQKEEKFIKDRTNSAKFEITEENVTTYKERFKNITEFQVKSKRGEIALKITTKK